MMNGQRDEWGVWDAAPQFVKKIVGVDTCDECILS